MKIFKSCYGTWMAESFLPFKENQKICVTTMKRSSGNITTTAKVGIQEDYFFVFSPFTDFNQTLISSSERCTKPAVEQQHIAALAMLDSIRPAALAHHN
jgi:hypothetical protein